MKNIIILSLLFLCASHLSAQDIKVGMSKAEVRKAFGGIPIKAGNMSSTDDQIFATDYAAVSVLLASRGSMIINYDSSLTVIKLSWIKDNDNGTPLESDVENALILLESTLGKGKKTGKKNHTTWLWKKDNVSYMLSKNFTDILDRKIYYIETQLKKNN